MLTTISQTDYHAQVIPPQCRGQLEYRMSPHRLMTCLLPNNVFLLFSSSRPPPKKLHESKTLNTFFYTQKIQNSSIEIFLLYFLVFSAGEDKSNAIVTDFVCVSVIFPLQLECLQNLSKIFEIQKCHEVVSMCVSILIFPVLGRHFIQLRIFVFLVREISFKSSLIVSPSIFHFRLMLFLGWTKKKIC